ncbi:MAG TPA: hypothetical protein VJ508_00800, partial [Saprospiraceae bacterium]|nr:hypothetical protein [Saprospiraceae bacterium]
MFGNGVKAYYTDSTAQYDIIDPNFPTEFVKGWAYLDGTLYVMKKDCSIIGTQNLDDPSIWDPLNLIVANIEPGEGVALTKHLSYVIALKQWDVEVFYDAGNPTGSPLKAVEGAKAGYGCVSADSVQEIDDELFWLTSNRTVSPQVVKMSNLQVSVISTPAIDRQLDRADFSDVFSWVFKHGGHKFYGLTVKNADITLVYDISQNLWYQWTDADGHYWPIVDHTFNGDFEHLCQHETNGKIYLLEGDYAYPNDDGVIVPVDIYAPNYDGGVNRKKQLSKMYFNADQTKGSTLFVRHSEDDYQS